MSTAAAQELIELSQKLLDCIGQRDWQTYQLLCDPTLSCFEPESLGHLVEGLDFHQFYFASKTPPSRAQNTLAAPRVRMLGDNAAVVTYTRLIQIEGADGARTLAFDETRVWERQQGEWRHVHFHRSANGG